jgi:hypothetical protein
MYRYEFLLNLSRTEHGRLSSRKHRTPKGVPLCLPARSINIALLRSEGALVVLRLRDLSIRKHNLAESRQHMKIILQCRRPG